jgi:hypothetical protein
MRSSTGIAFGTIDIQAWRGIVKHPFMAVSRTQAFYHVAPRRVRLEIQKHGVVDHSEGCIYAWADLSFAEKYKRAHESKGIRPEPMDIWEIEVPAGVSVVVDSETAPGGRYSRWKSAGRKIFASRLPAHLIA